MFGGRLSYSESDKMAAVAGPQYAPEDPTLPKPWKGLLDNTTGYLYFWNPETNATQYERPALPSAGGRVSLQVQTPVLQHIKGSYNDDGDKNSRGGIGVRSHQNGIGASVGTHFTSNGASGAMPSVHVGSLGTEGGLSADAYRSRHEITVMGGNVPSPFMSFDDAGFPSEILREVRQAGFSVPTPIQAQSWPIALQGQDLVAVAKTGSGKTLGYLIPGFLHLKRNHNIPQKNPTVLVLSPTRELATQIQDEAVKFGRTSRISCVCLYGGAPKGPQLRDLDRGVDIVVATPGRLNDILEMRRVNLNQVSYLVLDEADRMLDMGFEPQIRKIISEVPSRRQTLMFTATWPKEVRKIAADLLVNPVQVNIGNINELVANKAITQFVEVVPPMEKQRRLEQILRSQEPGSKIIIFCATKKMCDNLARNVTRQFRAAAIHGDKSQGERDYVLNQFKTGRSPVLVATDVAARGLDIKDIRVVVNYDFPTGIEDYVHRIGRTGRAGATGLAYTFLSEQDAKYAADLVKILEGSNQQVPPEVRQMALRGGGMRRPNRWSLGGGGRGGGGGGRGGGYDSGRGRWGSSGGRFEGRGGQDRFNNRGYGGDSGGSGRGGYSSFRSKNRSPSPSHKYGGRSRSRSMERF